MNWCCQIFKGWYDEAGGRGLGIVVGRSPTTKQPYFRIQYRAVDPGCENSVSSPNPVSVVSEIGIIFCPWCGRDLKTIYAKNVDELSRPDLEISQTDAA
jgi:hypothetical protein